MKDNIIGIVEFFKAHPEKWQYIKTISKSIYQSYVQRNSIVSDGVLDTDKDIASKFGGALPTSVDLMNTYAYNQGNSMKCTAYAETLKLSVMAVAKNKDQSLGFDPDVQWANQKEYPGTASDTNGDYLQAAPKALEKFGLEDNYGDMWRIKDWGVVAKDKWREVLANGSPIATGIKCTTRFCDQNYNWIPTETGYGHCVLVTGYDDERQAFICYNSYGNWGEQKTGRFYIKYSDHGKTWRGRIIEL